MTSDHEFEHGELVSRIPGLRRYVQNHGVKEAYAVRPLTHDGFSEMWFDDLAATREDSWIRIDGIRRTRSTGHSREGGNPRATGSPPSRG